MTKSLYRATYGYVTACGQGPGKHQVPVSRILKLLGVPRPGYYAWKKRGPSDSEKRREQIKDRIKGIYEEPHPNYGAPRITEKLKKGGRHISGKTVGNYMRQMGIRAQWPKHYTVTTIHPDLSSQPHNILDEQFGP